MGRRPIVSNNAPCFLFKVAKFLKKRKVLPYIIARVLKFRALSPVSILMQPFRSEIYFTSASTSSSIMVNEPRVSSFRDPRSAVQKVHIRSLTERKQGIWSSRYQLWGVCIFHSL